MKNLHLKLTLLVFIGTLWCSTVTVRAENIFSWDYISSGGSANIAHSMNMALSYENNMDFVNTIFDSIPFDPTNVGQTITVNDTNEPDYNSFVIWLTNGVNDVIVTENCFYQNLGCAGDLQEESSLFGTSNTSQNGIDFQGYIINSISFTLNALTLSTPGSDPNRNGNWTDYSLKGRFTVEVDTASVPEPSTLLLLASGLAGVIALRKRLR